MLEKHYTFASLLGDNLRHQIQRRFIVPTRMIFEKVDLSQPAQYERLNQLIGQHIHGLNVREVSIFNSRLDVVYSTSSLRLGRTGLSSLSARLVLQGAGPQFNLETAVPLWRMFFQLRLEENSVLLHVAYLLSFDDRPGRQSEEEGMQVLEFRQDISQHMLDVLRFQWGILGITLMSCLLIFFLLLFFLRRAERALAARAEEKNRLSLKLHEHEKLAGMGRVMAGIAHEIRNPLGIIRSSADLLLRRVQGLDNDSRSILRAINDEAARLSATVSDFLDYARPRAPASVPVDLAQLLEQAAAFMKPELEAKNIRLHWTPPARGLFMTSGDKNLLYRAVYNILNNAAQSLEGAAGEAGGDIWLELAPGEEERELCIGIRDNGPGFIQADPRACLEPFFTTKSGGSGLGLTIVENIVNSHQGRLELGNASQTGGARIKIHMPRAK